MISIIVLILSLLLFGALTIAILRMILKKQHVFGRPPIPLGYFVLAKMLVLINLVFLLLKGLNMPVYRIFPPTPWVDYLALVFLFLGLVILVLSAIELNKELIFGLPPSATHQLHTRGVFALSRHPFYFGFILILLSSCLFIPHPVNIVAFLGAWILHHLIMKKEEDYLFGQYGEEYREYAHKVKRYIIF